MKSYRSFVLGLCLGATLIAALVFFAFAFGALPLSDALLCGGVAISAATVAHMAAGSLQANRWNKAWWAAVAGILVAACMVFWVSVPVGKALIGLLCVVASGTVLVSRVRHFSPADDDLAAG